MRNVRAANQIINKLDDSNMRTIKVISQEGTELKAIRMDKATGALKGKNDKNLAIRPFG